MHVGEVVFGGVGSGLYGMLVFAIIAVFIAGLMVGRTPEYLGKKIEAFEMKMAALVVLIMPMAVLIGTAVAVATDGGKAGISNPGPHGFSEVLYAFTSAGNNNGSAFAGLNANTHVLQLRLGDRDARGPLLAGDSHAGHRRLAGAEEDHARQRRHAADAHAAVRRVPGGHGDLGRGVDVHSGVGPRADRGTLDDDGDETMTAQAKAHSLFDPAIVRRAIVDSFLKLDPRRQVRNPVMFTVYVGSILTTGLFVQSLRFGRARSRRGSFWPSRPGCGSRCCSPISPRRWPKAAARPRPTPCAAPGTRCRPRSSSVRPPSRCTSRSFQTMFQRGDMTVVPAADLRQGDVVLVEAGDYIPADGEVIDGIASVDESAITGESAPVIRESGGDRSGVTGGTRVLVRLARGAHHGQPRRNFPGPHDRHGRRGQTPKNAQRNRPGHPPGRHDDHLPAGLRDAAAVFAVQRRGGRPAARPITVTVLVALLVCLIPTTIGGLLSAIGIAGMDRMIQANVIAMSGRAVEAAGDVDVLLLDKTGTITLGNRQAVEFLPADGVDVSALADAAQLASLADETPEGRSIVVLAKTKYGLRGRNVHELHATFIPFSAQTRISGVNLRRPANPQRGRRRHRSLRAPARRRSSPPTWPARSSGSPSRAARRWSWPKAAKALGVIHLKDIVKGGMRERFAQMRQMGIQTVMITGDNPLTAAAIAAEAGVDDFLAEATPETKLSLIRKYQAGGHLVAMTGDGTNDSPALAQADVAVAMNTGTQAAKEAGNMVDLDSNPTKLIEIVEIGKQLLMTRGALTTFSLANDVSKYFAIIPAAFAGTYPVLGQAEHHAAGHAGQRDPLGGDFQRPDYRGADPAGVAGRAVSAHRRGGPVAAESLGVRPRRADRAVYRHQTDRHDSGGVAFGVIARTGPLVRFGRGLG